MSASLEGQSESYFRIRRLFSPPHSSKPPQSGLVATGTGSPCYTYSYLYFPLPRRLLDRQVNRMKRGGKTEREGVRLLHSVLEPNAWSSVQEWKIRFAKFNPFPPSYTVLGDYKRYVCSKQPQHHPRIGLTAHLMKGLVCLYYNISRRNEWVTLWIETFYLCLCNLAGGQTCCILKEQPQCLIYKHRLP